MKRVDLKVGYSCNLHCKHCAQGDKREKSGDQSGERIKKELQESINRGIKEVVFTGGEPTIRKDIMDLVRFAKEIGFKQIQLQTNGRMFASKKFTDAIVEAGMTEFAPALNGHIPALHDYLASTPGAWKQTVQGIMNVREYEDIPIGTNSVVSKPNYRFLDKIASLLVKLGVNQYQLAFVHPSGSAWTNFDSIVPLISLATPMIHKGLDVGRKVGLRVMAEAMPYCLMRGYEDCIGERYIPSSLVYEVNFVRENFEVWRTTEGKWKGDKCKACSAYNVCEGPWREYVEVRGESEFTPF
jgi:MoaA/NifB/PqqE/SkfB family radical SAM enzyme